MAGSGVGGVFCAVDLKQTNRVFVIVEVLLLAEEELAVDV